ncbi:MAG: cohesin domain-containing protein, partial [Elusimicrobiota bacterium]
MNTRKWIQVGLALFSCAMATSAGAAPSLTVGSVSGQAGATVTLPITFDPGTSSVASMQFNITVPAGLSTGPITLGPVLNTAVKSVSANLTGGTWTFIIFGFNQTTIASGSLLTAELKISATATGTLSLPVSGVVYSDPNGTSITGTGTGGTLTVLPPAPVITSAGTATGQVGTAFSYQITASNSPTSFSATGLPAGLSVSAL